MFTSYEPYLLKCFSTHFGLCLMYKNYTCGKKDTTRCREKRQLLYEPDLHGSFPPAFTAPVPISIPLPQPSPHCGSVTWTTLLSTFWNFSSNSLTPGLLLPSLQAQVYFFFVIKSDRMSGWLPWLPLPRWVLCFCGAGTLISVWGDIPPILP